MTDTPEPSDPAKRIARAVYYGRDCWECAEPEEAIEELERGIYRHGLAELEAQNKKLGDLLDIHLDEDKRSNERIRDLESRLAAAEKPKLFPIQSSRKYGKPHPTKIPWDVADLAYSVYSAKYGREQSLERLAQRGGFGPGEMDVFLPDWIERCDRLAASERGTQEVIRRWRDDEAVWAKNQRKIWDEKQQYKRERDEARGRLRDIASEVFIGGGRQSDVQYIETAKLAKIHRLATATEGGGDG